MFKEKKTYNFNLNYRQIKILKSYISEIKKTNTSLNLVGKSTLVDPWNRHILDSLQISELIKCKKSTILDMGTGAGLPGVILLVSGYKNITMVDSKKKKTEFINKFIDKHNIKASVLHARLESLNLPPFQYIVSRALAPLHKLFNYSLLFSNSKTTLVFLKGRNVNNEIIEAKKFFYFDYKLVESKSVGGGAIIVAKNFKKND